MPIGVWIDNIMVAAGGLAGGHLGKYIPERVKESLNHVFGFAATAVGITLIIHLNNLGAVVLSVILGAFLGTLLNLESRVNAFFSRLNARIVRGENLDPSCMSLFATILALSCCSGAGIFGAMNEALTGDRSAILCKAILDFFTIFIFSAKLGTFCAVIALPQAAILGTVFFCAKLIAPLMTPELSGDFSAVGGILELIIAFRIMKLTQMKALDALPSLLLIFPVFYLWKMFF